jgi:hydroxymethylbilane synthase
MSNRATGYFTAADMLPAVGQGALCIEIRENDPDVSEMISALDHSQTRTIVSGERAFLNRLEGGCQIPIAGHGKIENDRYKLTGLVAEVDGSRLIKDTASGPIEASERIGIELAERLLATGADKLLAKIKDRA